MTSTLLALINIDFKWLFVAVAVVALVIAFVFCLKYPKVGKWVLLGVFLVIYVGFTIFCGLQLNYYYKAQGGIYGAISGIFDTNQVKVVDEVTYTFENIELTQVQGDTYSASITTNEVLSLENKEYGVYVNDMPCYYVENADDYVIAKYTYSFLAEDKSVLCTDTLTFRFAFYTNSTYLNLSTDGGAEAVKYWHYYFNKNKFEVTLGERDYVSSDDLTYGEGDTSDYVTVTYYVDDELYVTQVYKKGTRINFPIVDKYTFKGWFCGDTHIYNTHIVESAMRLDARFDLATLTITNNGAEGFEYHYEDKSYYAQKPIRTEPVSRTLTARSRGEILFSTGGEITDVTVDCNGWYDISHDGYMYKVAWRYCTYITITFTYGAHFEIL